VTTPVRIGAFVAALAVIFAAALGVGRAVGPVEEPEPEPAAAGHGGGGHGGAGGSAAAHGGGDHGAAAEPTVPGGLMISQDGYALALDRTRVRPGRGVPVSFRITGPGGAPVADYDVEHGKLLHLIAVRRDNTGFQHVHPVLRDGTWHTRLDLAPGSWRLFADFTPTGADGLTLGADLAVPGAYTPAPSTPVTRSDSVDGYTVTLDGDLHAGEAAELTLTVSRAGRPVTDLQPYLGAYGHLVALREGDLAYLHVHPEGSPGDGVTTAGPEVTFVAEVPSAGRYRLYLDFRHRGTVRTAAFTVEAHR